MGSRQYWLVFVQVQALMFIASSINIIDCPLCGGGWKRVSDDDFCYNASVTPGVRQIDFVDTQKYCKQLDPNARLAILKTKQSRDNFKHFVAAADFYKVFIGLQRSGPGSEWKWLDGTSQDIKLLEDTIEEDPANNTIYLKKQYKGGYKYIADKLWMLNEVICQKECPLTASTPEGAASGGDLGLAVIIGIAAGGVLLVILLIVGVVVLVKKRRATGGQTLVTEAGTQQTMSGATTSQEVTAKDDPGAGITTKDLFCGTEMDHGIGTKDLFGATEADHASNASLNLASVEK